MGMVSTGLTSENGLNFIEQENYASTSIDFDARALLGGWRSPMKHTNDSIQILGIVFRMGLGLEQMLI